jgi:hypothetical protein
MRMHKPRLRWALPAALLASLIVAGLAGAADPTEGVGAGPAAPDIFEDACDSDLLEVPCIDGLNSNAGANAIGVRGGHVASSGTGPGVRGFTNSSSGAAIGVVGQVNSGTPGGFSAAVRGINNGTGGNGIGVWGSQAGSGWGVFGETPSGLAVFGSTTSGTGVLGNSSSGIGVDANTSTGTAAVNGDYNGSGGGFGVRGFTASGNGNTAGVRGINNTPSGGGVGVWGSHSGTGWGVFGHSAFGTGVVGSTNTGLAGLFMGNVNVTGTLTKGAGSFKIDHPLDPARKYLQHSFVESPDMMNVYNGNVTTDGKGFARVTLPGYFQALNENYRYQLTVLGRSFARAIVWEEIKGDSFLIRTDEPEVRVSWQVTGIRKDAYAKAHRIPVETLKPKLEQGTYLNPELYGQPRSKSVLGAQMRGQAAKHLDAYTRAPKRLPQRSYTQGLPKRG